MLFRSYTFPRNGELSCPQACAGNSSYPCPFFFSSLINRLTLGRLSVCKVLGETMHIMTQYLANEEKVVVANSKVEALETEASGLWNDLGAAMDAFNASKEQAKVLTEQLEFEKQLVK